jgi:hypothetical protein
MGLFSSKGSSKGSRESSSSSEPDRTWRLGTTSDAPVVSQRTSDRLTKQQQQRRNAQNN